MSFGQPKEPVENKKKGGCISAIVSFVMTVAIIVGSFFALRMYVLGTYEVPTTSMIETIQVGDRVFADKVMFRADLKPGDVVTFVKPNSVRESNGRYIKETYVKRIIAVAGQTVELVGGYVYVDGVALDEPYVEGKPTYPLETPASYTNENPQYPYTVPEGEVWVMGDNRVKSNDSRAFGSIPVDTITGRAFFTYWPLSRVGVLK